MQMSLIFFVTKEIGDISMSECFHLELSPFSPYIHKVSDHSNVSLAFLHIFYY